MEMAANMVSIICLCVSVCCLLMMRRNDAVLKFRQELLEQVSAAANADVDAGKEWKWRYLKLEYVTYEEMLWPPWKKLVAENYWGHLGFLFPDDKSKGN